MTRVDELLARGRTLSFEVMPPRKRHPDHGAVEELEAIEPSFVSVTAGAGGRTREGTHDLVVELLRTTTPMAHVATMGQTRDALRATLERYRDDGLANILALRGDPPLHGTDLPPTELPRASQLVTLARDVGDFCVGVALHPEGHPEATDRSVDFDHQAAKLAAADFGMTQFFFDIDHYQRLVGEMHTRDVQRPILPGLIAPTSVQQLQRMASMAGASVPAAVADRLQRHGNDEAAVARSGVDIVVALAEQLLALGAPGIHLYTLNHAEPARAISERLGFTPVRANP